MVTRYFKPFFLILFYYYYYCFFSSIFSIYMLYFKYFFMNKNKSLKKFIKLITKFIFYFSKATVTIKSLIEQFTEYKEMVDEEKQQVCFRKF